MPVTGSPPEYTEAASSRHAGSGARQRNSRLRRTYFGMAAFWGYIVGSVTVLTALQAQNALTSGPGIGIAIYVVPAALLAIGGGLLISRAYRDAKRR